jgi:hypothetical protein
MFRSSVGSAAAIADSPALEMIKTAAEYVKSAAELI